MILCHMPEVSGKILSFIDRHCHKLCIFIQWEEQSQWLDLWQQQQWNLVYIISNRSICLA